MRHWLALAILMIACIVTAIGAERDQSPDTQPASAEDREEVTGQTVKQSSTNGLGKRSEPLSGTFMKRILDQAQIRQQKLKELKNRLRHAEDQELAVDLLQRIEATKLGIERHSLEVQLNRAVETGRTEDARSLSRAIDRIDAMRTRHPALNETAEPLSESE